MTKLEWGLEKEKCRRDAHYFIFDSHHVLTKDEHDQQDARKPMPDKPHLRVNLDFLLVSGHCIQPTEATYALDYGYSLRFLSALGESGICFFEKSRQQMATWIVCAYLLWRARSYDYQLLMVQSKREEDSADLVYTKEPDMARISCMENGVPKELRVVDLKRQASFGHIYFPNGSHLWAIPEGGDIIRSKTPSVLFSDEAAFQPEFGMAYTAAAPAITGGGQLIAVSSAEPGEFQEICESHIGR